MSVGEDSKTDSQQSSNANESAKEALAELINVEFIGSVCVCLRWSVG